VRLSGHILLAALLLLEGKSANASWTFEPVDSSQLKPAEGLLKPCEPSRWRPGVGGMPAIKTAACGDFRGDGVERMYAQLADGSIAEVEIDEGGSASVYTLLNAKDIQIPTFPARFSAILEKGGARPSLYVATFAWVLKYEWNGQRFTMEYLSTRNTAIPSGFAVGDFRGGGQIPVFRF